MGNYHTHARLPSPRNAFCTDEIIIKKKIIILSLAAVLLQGKEEVVTVSVNLNL